jgi:peptidoglycan/LPS O-acetylase OafA/YrhL
MNIVSEALEPPPSSLKYLPQLDAIRALAVLLVLGHHWIQPPHAPGPVGVWIFFGLSGFLITRILLKSRGETLAQNGEAIRNFYIRRFLRIFPLYYFVLFVALVTSLFFLSSESAPTTSRTVAEFAKNSESTVQRLNSGESSNATEQATTLNPETHEAVPAMHGWDELRESLKSLRADWPWYVSYLQNFMMISATKYDVIFGTHLWSLAVEEQFYVFWPLLMLFMPRKTLLPLISIAIIAGVAIRVYLAHIGWDKFEVYILTPSNLDTLGLGALLAYFVTYLPRSVVRLRWASLALGIATFGAALVLKKLFNDNSIVSLSIGLITLWMVSMAADGFPGIIGRIISWAPIIYIGRISYGIYVYHYFVPIVMRPVFDRMGIGEGNVVFAAICFVITIIIASLSWFLMEKPINELKDRFAPTAKPAR